MASSAALLALSVSLIFLRYFAPTTTTAQLELLYHECYENNGDYTSNGTYEANLNQLLDSLTENTTRIGYGGFYNVSYGQNPNKVYANALCRPDMEPDSCRDCINVAKRNLTSLLCPNKVMAIVGYDDRGFNNCMLRFANYDIFHLMENAPYFFVYGPSNITENIGGFNQTRKRLLERLFDEAAARASPNKYATGEELVSGILTLYALVQCTPDLSETDCRRCLNDTIKLMSECCDRRQGGRVINPSCSFRYETNKFYKPSIEGPIDSPGPVPPPPSPETTSSTPKGDHKKKKNHTVLIVVIIASGVAFLILLIGGICMFLRLRKSEEEDEYVEEIISAKSLQFEFGTIRVATDNFSENNKLGQGGFGAVYKGMLPNGEPVAVKRLSENSNQGEAEFKNEVLLVAKLQHRNLVRLLGFCFERKERILVYEFVPNASLDHFLFNPINREHLNWERRYKIIEGIARGLLYLHEDSRFRIVHRDLKASNVLLDAEMNAKISDFGTARLFDMDQTHCHTIKVAGTFGYMAPEYVMHGRFSVKSDVFSFGVLVLEIVSGQRRSSFGGEEEETEDLLTYAWRNWNEGAALNLMDPTLSGGSTTEIMKCIHIGLLCVQENISDRPSMASVVNLLDGDTVTLATPNNPGFFMNSSVILESSSSLEHHSRSTESDEHRIQNAPLSINEASITELSPR